MATLRIADASRQLSEIVNRVAEGQELIILTSDGQPKAVLLGVEAFEDLVGMREHSCRQLMPLDSLQKQFQQALLEAGYDSHEKIVKLVQEVKQEMAAERQQKFIPLQEAEGKE